jgi:hypothetical protein
MHMRMHTNAYTRPCAQDQRPERRAGHARTDPQELWVSPAFVVCEVAGAGQAAICTCTHAETSNGS